MIDALLTWTGLTGQGFSILVFTVILSGIVCGVSLALLTTFGVMIGQWLFIPRFAAYYRPSCLSLLCASADSALVRTKSA